MALAGLGAYVQSKQERGLQWYQEETFGGEILDRTNLAPMSVYLASGHLLNLWIRGEAISDDLKRDVMDQLGLSRITRDLGTFTTLDEAISFMLASFDDETVRQDWGGFLVEMLKVSLGDIGSGFTRPLEPFNVAVGAIRGQAPIVDQRQVVGPEGVIRGFTRYLDNVFAPLFEEFDIEGPPRQDITSLTPVYDPNPVDRMFGNRHSAPPTDINLLLARANIAPWTANERSGIPEWDAIMNEIVTPTLNLRARALMETPAWRDANQRTRERMARLLLTTVKREVRNWVETRGDYNQYLRNEQQRYQSLPESLRIQAAAALDIEGSERNYTLYQIEMLRAWIEDRREFESLITR